MTSLRPPPSTVRREFVHALRGRCSRLEYAFSDGLQRSEVNHVKFNANA
jgi:hypothetical protein